MRLNTPSASRTSFSTARTVAARKRDRDSTPEEDRALVTLIRKGWGRDTPAFRQVFTSTFFRSDADPALVAHFNEMQRLSADPDTAARYHESCHRRGDGRDLYRQLRLPVLILHGRDDLAVSADEGRLLASIIPGQSTRAASERNALFPHRRRSRHQGRPCDRTISSSTERVVTRHSSRATTARRV